MSEPYDALLVVSFGGPEGMDEVLPFLENVLRGRNVPRERLLLVAHHYELFDGVSPINEQNRRLINALRAELDAHNIRLPIYWGNRNWHPFLADALREMRDDGIKRALAFVTSAYNSYSGCRQYRENIERARTEVGEDAPRVEKLRAFYNHPGFVEPNVENLKSALAQIPVERHDAARVAFTAHSIPASMAAGCDYEAQLLETCRLVATGAGAKNWRLVFQSRSGSPAQPWLEPDICDHLRELNNEGTHDVVVHPVGFISDHMEVLYDLDTEARAIATEIGINMIRAATVGTHPAFVSMIRELILERTSEGALRRALGTRGASHDVCATDCCLPGTMRPAPRAATHDDTSAALNERAAN
ncbi:MAG: protoporphyrin/coproporphyrin ferrochelatase [Acidobacteriota bacterium]|jgi:ferrochelatase|nr:protoporphyrin/coproporphyrin ferrochelatase [Acidobacteriota bacterium]